MATIALFGATGGTGSAFLKLALAAGHSVRALVRTPSKLQTKCDELIAVEGSLSDADKVEEVVTGADYVVVMTGAMGKAFQQNMQLNFITLLHPIMQKVGAKMLLYQAGALCPVPGEPNPFRFRLMRATVGRAMGLDPLLSDHDNALNYISANMKGGDIKFIVSRPGAGGLTPGESSGKPLVVVAKPAMKSTMYVDLAQWSLDALKDESLYGTFSCPE